MKKIPYLLASIGIKPKGTLAETAEVLGQALGVTFAPDNSGYYEEFPAYCADVMGLRLALLGIPEPEYSIQPIKDNSFELQMAPVPEIWRLIEEPRGDNLDISSFVSEVIKKTTGLECWAHDDKVRGGPNENSSKID